MNYRVQSTNRLIRLSMSVSAASLLAALAAPASAQEVTALGTAAAQAAPQDVPLTPEEQVAEGDVTVTGTRIVRDGFQAPTPLTVLTLEDIQNTSPSNNVADFVNQTPSIAGSLAPQNSRLNLSSGNAGINALNLRNLGSERTLVLLDGRRSVASTPTGLIDVNTFPQALIRSVEVVTGGASAAYGSDAVAGVVNFVLNKELEGLRVSADVGVTDKGDGFNHSMSVAGGMSFAGGRGRLLLSGELARRDGIFEVDREWNQLGYRTIVNPAFAVGNGQPRNLVVSGAGTNNATPGGIINSSTAIAGSGVAANSLRGIYFGPGGQPRNFDYGLQAGTLSVGGDWALADNSRNIGLSAAEDRQGIFGRLSFEATPWATIYFEGAYNETESLFNAGPQFTTAGSAVTFRSDNAFLINALGSARLRGINTVTIGTTHVDMPYRASNNSRNVQRYTLGAEGAFEMFGNRAFWSAYGQYGEANAREQLRDIQNLARMNLAVDAVFAPAGNALGVPAGTIVCRSSLNAPGNGCVPLNRLGIGVTSSEAIDWVLGDPYRDQELKQTVVGVNLSVTPFATWGGDVSVAVGGEYRRDELSGFVPQEFQVGWQVGNFLPSFGRSNVKEAYLETVIPLGWGADFNGAVRATDYSLAGYVTTWKVGLTYQPIEDVRFRVSRSRDIRAPNLNDLFAAGTSRVGTVADPFPDPITGERDVIRTFREQTTGNPNLRPETANSTNVGVVLQPSFMPGLSFSVDAYRIELEGAIGQFLAPSIILRCFEGRQEFCDAYGPDPRGDRELLFSAQPFNYDRIIRRGIDFELGYGLPVERLFSGSAGTLAARAMATHYIEHLVDTGFNEPVNTAGSNGGGTPNWIFRTSITYDTPDFSISAVGRGVSAGNIGNLQFGCATDCPVYDPTQTTTESNLLTISSNRASGTFYTDLNITQKIEIDNANMQFFVNVTNLFDRRPMLLPEGGLSASTTFGDLLGRSFRIGVRMQTR